MSLITRVQNALRGPAAAPVPATPEGLRKWADGNGHLVQILNAMTRGDTGIGTNMDLGTQLSPQSRVNNPLLWEQMLYGLYAERWECQKIVDIPCDDLLREGWDYKGVPEPDAKRLEEAAAELNMLQAFGQALRLERLLGGSAIFMGVADGMPAAYPLDPEFLQKGCLRFLNVLPRTLVKPARFDANPLSPHYGKPELYWIGAQHVHRSRLVLFDGSPLLPVPSLTMSALAWQADGFGESKITGLYDDITRAAGTRQAAMQMAQRSGAFVAYTDIETLGATKQGQEAISELASIANQLNAFRGAVMQRDVGGQDTITTITPSFGSVPELVISFLVVLSAASDIPATRFLGQAPGGLNSSGEGDLENYYGRLESQQKQGLQPKLRQVLSVLVPSTFGVPFDPQALSVEFKPLWSLSQGEQATVRQQDATTITTLYDTGLLDEAQAMAELQQREVLVGEYDAPGAGTGDDGIPAPMGDDPASQLAAVTAALQAMTTP